jgi:hypothetical protein
MVHNAGVTHDSSSGRQGLDIRTPLQDVRKHGWRGFCWLRSTDDSESTERQLEEIVGVLIRFLIWYSRPKQMAVPADIKDNMPRARGLL